MRDTLRGAARQVELGRVVGLTSGRGVAALLSAGWLVGAARLLRLNAFGRLTLILALGGVFGVIADLGMSLLLTKVAAERKGVRRSYLRSALLIRLGASAVGAAILVPAYAVTTSRADLVAPALFGLSLMATAVYSSFTAVLRGLGRVGIEAWNEVLSRLLVLGLGLELLVRGGGLRTAIAVYAFADVVSAIVVPVVAWRSLTWDEAADTPRRPSWRHAGALSLAGTVSILYSRLDQWLLALMAGAPAVGLYGAAVKLAESAQLPARSLASLVLAVAAPGRGTGPGSGVATWGVALTLPGAAVGMLLARPLLGLAFGPRYTSATTMTVVLLAATVPGAAAATASPLVAARRSRSLVLVMVGGLVLNVAANLVLVPALGGLGAALATLGGETFLAVCLVRLVRRLPGQPGQPAGTAASGVALAEDQAARAG